MNEEEKISLKQLAKDNTNFDGYDFTDEEYMYIEGEIAKATNDTERAELMRNAILKLYNDRKLSKNAIDALDQLSEHIEHNGDETYTTYASLDEDITITRHKKQ